MCCLFVQCLLSLAHRPEFPRLALRSFTLSFRRALCELVTPGLLGMMQTLIERNTTIPTNKSQDFTTFEDSWFYFPLDMFFNAIDFPSEFPHNFSIVFDFVHISTLSSTLGETSRRKIKPPSRTTRTTWTSRSTRASGPWSRTATVLFFAWDFLQCGCFSLAFLMFLAFSLTVLHFSDTL